MHSTSTVVAVTVVVDHAERDHMDTKENAHKISTPSKVVRAFANPQRINL